MIYIFCPSIGYILDCDSAFQPQIATARADRQTNRPCWLAPPLLHHVPYREVVPRHGDRDRRLLPGRQLDIREPLEYGGRLPSGRGEVDVQLRDLSQVQVGSAKSPKTRMGAHIHTSPPNTDPVFVTVNVAWYAGWCSQSALEEPSAMAVALPCSQARMKGSSAGGARVWILDTCSPL